jgi:hypothetical protein
MKFYLIIAAWVIGAPMIMVFTYQTKINTAFVLFPTMAILGVASMRIRCPQCRQPVGYLGYGFWGPFVPRNCRKCGHDLTIA